MKNIAELLFAIVCIVFSLAMLSFTSILSLEGNAALLFIVVAALFSVIGISIGIHGFFTRK